MPELWFVAGVALGTIVTGFAAVGSFARGSDSVQRKSWSREHALRLRAPAPRAAFGARVRHADDEVLRNAS
jgi:hypothetical protein